MENSEGKIKFGEILDLTNVLDLENNVLIQKGIIAINSTKYPELNKKATITLEGLSYDSVPEIFYTNKFTSNQNEINQVCDFCAIVNYTNFPTANGKVVFETEHFSSFLVGNSGNSFDLNLLQNTARCISGSQGNINVDLSEPDNGEEFNPGENMEIKADVENLNSDGKSIIFKAVLYNLDKNDEEEKVQETEIISSGEEEIFDLNFDISEDIDDSDDFVLYVKAYEKDGQEEQCAEGVVNLDIKREKHDTRITDVEIGSEQIYSGESLSVVVKGQNFGSDNEDNVQITLSVLELNISESSETFDLEEFDENDGFEKTFYLKIPENAEAGNYQVVAKVNFNDESDEKSAGFSVFKRITLNYPNENTILIPEKTVNNYSTNTITGNIVSSKNDETFKNFALYLVVANLLAAIAILFVIILKRR